VSRFLTVHQHK